MNAQVGINGTFSSAIDEGIIKDEKVIDAINIYWKWLFHRDTAKFTTREEITLINKTLDTVIGYLKATYKLQ